MAMAAARRVNAGFGSGCSSRHFYSVPPALRARMSVGFSASLLPLQACKPFSVPVQPYILSILTSQGTAPHPCGNRLPPVLSNRRVGVLTGAQPGGD